MVGGVEESVEKIIIDKGKLLHFDGRLQRQTFFFLSFFILRITCTNQLYTIGSSTCIMKANRFLIHVGFKDNKDIFINVFIHSIWVETVLSSQIIKQPNQTCIEIIKASTTLSSLHLMNFRWCSLSFSYTYKHICFLHFSVSIRSQKVQLN